MIFALCVTLYPLRYCRWCPFATVKSVLDWSLEKNCLFSAQWSVGLIFLGIIFFPRHGDCPMNTGLHVVFWGDLIVTDLKWPFYDDSLMAIFGLHLAPKLFSGPPSKLYSTSNEGFNIKWTIASVAPVVSRGNIDKGMGWIFCTLVKGYSSLIMRYLFINGYIWWYHRIQTVLLNQYSNLSSVSPKKKLNVK